eukprot:Clim_evm9s25 gene=Clim_evmTU9s25
MRDPKYTTVIFDVGGVLLDSPVHIMRDYEKEIGMPSLFFGRVIAEKKEQSAFARLERGEFGLVDFAKIFQSECEDYARRKDFTVKDYNIPKLFNRMTTTISAIPHMVQAARFLRLEGYKVGIITNNWIDDTSEESANVSGPGFFLADIADVVIESCKVGMRKPDPRIYELCLERLNSDAEETIFLDDLYYNLRTPRKMGMTAIEVPKDTRKALAELEKTLGDGICLHFDRPVPPHMALISPPRSVNPKDVSHGYAQVNDDCVMHYVEIGQGPAVVLVHGFPEFWYSWRRQLSALAMAGFRAIAIDLRGFGDSTGPGNPKRYSHEVLCQDLSGLLDKLGINKAYFVGHDHGGSIVWSMALHYPHRMFGVVGVNTPYQPVDPKTNPWVYMNDPNNDIGKMEYQLYFNRPVQPERELEQDLHRTFGVFLRTADMDDRVPMSTHVSTGNVRKRGGFLVGFPEKVGPSKIASSEDIEEYVKAYTKSGMRGPLSLYRNIEENWKFHCRTSKRDIQLPALMVIGRKDRILTPDLAKSMDRYVPRLRKVTLDCGHWTMMEKAQELNETLITWLLETEKTKHKTSKL